MGVITNAGTQLAISAGPPVANDSASFALLSYVVIGEVVSIGEAGAVYAEVSHSPLESRRVQTFKGSVNDGTRAIGLGKDISDAGQVILLEGADGLAVDTVHSLRMTDHDGGIEYAQGLVMSYSRNPGTIDQIIGANAIFKVINKIIDA